VLDIPSVLAKPHKVNIDPFPHIVIDDCLPSDFYDRLAGTFPDWRGYGVTEPNKRVDWCAKKALSIDLGPEWQGFLSYHTSRAFFSEVLRDFSPYIRLMHPLADMNVPSGMRFSGMGEFVLDCQIGINTPSPELTRVRGPHVDNPVELWGGMLYMPIEPGGDLILYRHKGFPKFIGKAELRDEDVEEVGRVICRPNTFVLFLNGINSVHGVSPRMSTHPRRLVNFVGEFHNPLFELPR
jgi:hypothetical protein